MTRAEVGRSIVMRRFHARGRGRSAQIEKWFSHMKIVVAEQQEDADDDVIEATPVRTARTVSPATDHATTDTTLSVPETEGTAAEAAEQSMSADAASHATAGEHSPGAGQGAMTDHAHTEPTLAVPETEGTEAEAAEQAMSADAAKAADDAAAPETPPETPPESGQGAT